MGAGMRRFAKCINNRDMEKRMRKASAIFLLVLALTFYTAGTYSGAASAVSSLSKDESAGTMLNSPDFDPGYYARGYAAQPFGAVQVDQDLYPYHAGDVNQFGDDEAYNSTNGHSSIGNMPPIHKEGQ